MGSHGSSCWRSFGRRLRGEERGVQPGRALGGRPGSSSLRARVEKAGTGLHEEGAARGTLWLHLLVTGMLGGGFTFPMKLTPLNAPDQTSSITPRPLATQPCAELTPPLPTLPQPCQSLGSSSPSKWEPPGGTSCSFWLECCSPSATGWLSLLSDGNSRQHRIRHLYRPVPHHTSLFL